MHVLFSGHDASKLVFFWEVVHGQRVSGCAHRKHKEGEVRENGVFHVHQPQHCEHCGRRRSVVLLSGSSRQLECSSPRTAHSGVGDYAKIEQKLFWLKEFADVFRYLLLCFFLCLVPFHKSFQPVEAGESSLRKTCRLCCRAAYKNGRTQF